MAEILLNDLSIILEDVGTSMSRSINADKIGNVDDCPFQYCSMIGPMAKNFEAFILMLFIINP